jgi:molecular chaperone DnaK
MARAVGIDLGTTNSVIATMEGREPTVVVNSEGTDNAIGGGVHRQRRLVGSWPAGRRSSIPKDDLLSERCRTPL